MQLFIFYGKTMIIFAVAICLILVCYMNATKWFRKLVLLYYPDCVLSGLCEFFQMVDGSGYIPLCILLYRWDACLWHRQVVSKAPSHNITASPGRLRTSDFMRWGLSVWIDVTAFLESRDVNKFLTVPPDNVIIIANCYFVERHRHIE